MHDVIVIGLGGMGSAAAYHLARRGQRVLGLERYTAPHDRGSSHGGSRIIRQAYHEHPNYVPLVQRAYELWEQLEAESGTDILRITGGLNIGPPGSSIVEGALRSARTHLLAHEVLDSAELRRRFPALRPRPDDSAVFETRAGYVRPEAAVLAHLQLAARNGAELRFEEPVQSWSALRGGGVRVVTAMGVYEAEHVVIVPGAWAPDLLANLNVPFDVRRQVMFWFRPRQSIELPIYIYDVDGHNVFYGFPSTGDVVGGIKAAMHTAGQPCTADAMNRSTSEADASDLRQNLAAFVPDLNGPLLKASACLYTLTPDEHFIIAAHPDHTQVTVAAGFSGHGFKFVTVVGEILADLAVTGSTKHPIEFFSPARFSLTL
jgi:sarcosine oxidase